jgi:hypothetical protein
MREPEGIIIPTERLQTFLLLGTAGDDSVAGSNRRHEIGRGRKGVRPLKRIYAHRSNQAGALRQ